MSARQLTRGRIARALDVVLQLDLDALADLADRIIDRLDVLEPDVDREAEEDGCEAEDTPQSHRHGIGDATDAEPDDDREPDHDSEPLFPASHHGAEVLGARCWTGATLA